MNTSYETEPGGRVSPVVLWLAVVAQVVSVAAVVLLNASDAVEWLGFTKPVLGVSPAVLILACALAHTFLVAVFVTKTVLKP